MKKKNIIILSLAVLTIAGSVVAADADSSVVVTRSMAARMTDLEKQIIAKKDELSKFEKEAATVQANVDKMKAERDPIIARMASYEKGLFLPYRVIFEQEIDRLKNLQTRIALEKKTLAGLAASKISAVYYVQKEPVSRPRAGSMAKLMADASKASAPVVVAGTSLKRSNAFGPSDYAKRSRATAAEPTE